MRYRFAIVFRSSIVLERTGLVDIIEDIGSVLSVLSLVVRFLTEDIRTLEEAKERTHHIEDLVDDAGVCGYISSHLLEDDVAYLKVCQIFHQTTLSLLRIFEDCGFYNHCRSYLIYRPHVVKLAGRDQYAIYVKKVFDE